MKLHMGSDHAAFEEKETLKNFLKDLGHEIIDHGPENAERCDYPDYAAKVAKAVAKDDSSMGILLCGSGIGVSMAANRYQNIRAALVRSEEDALLSRGHNNANILCVGARLTSIEDIKVITKKWLETPFEEGRHTGRVAKFNDLGEKV
ncbi:MAG: ribose 5-phosphate isomerase B [Halobacteriovoraceae bacterium]|nr:ribose 5-phosphate isomerase B [Halobacteriovoraceae bacterium]|tara:strand:- start:244 stop:687 length:444 start_codon:yes stop_codon:yes gene_type:complete